MIKGLLLMSIVPLLVLFAMLWAYITPTWYSIAIASVLVVAALFEVYIVVRSNVQ